MSRWIVLDAEALPDTLREGLEAHVSGAFLPPPLPLTMPLLPIELLPERPDVPPPIAPEPDHAPMTPEDVAGLFDVPAEFVLAPSGKKRRLRRKVKHLRAELAALHETHRRTKKSEHTLQSTVGKLQSRIRSLEDRGFHRDHWKSDAPLEGGSVVFVKFGTDVHELRVASVSWRREGSPQWTLRLQRMDEQWPRVYRPDDQDDTGVIA